MEHIKNAFSIQPFASWSLVLGGVAIIGMPLSALFLPKISILLQAAALSPWLLIGLLFIFLFATAAFGVFLVKLLTRRDDGNSEEMKRYNPPLGMKLPIAVLLIIVFVLGVFFPEQLTNLLKTIVTELGVR